MIQPLSLMIKREEKPITNAAKLIKKKQEFTRFYKFQESSYS